MVKCAICGLYYKKVTNTHISKHNISVSDYKKKFPRADRGLTPWNKGKNKYSDVALRELSRKLSQQNTWNFTNWQKRRKEERERRIASLKKNRHLAEFIGIILGDGNLIQFPRTQGLRIVCHSEKKAYIKHIVNLVQQVFNKTPSARKRKGEKANDIILYSCGLSNSLGIPCGNKIKNRVAIPRWIKLKRMFAIKCLKGLFETDGCFQVDKDNYAQYIELKNNCITLLKDAHQVLKNLGYHPQLGKNYVRLARRTEVAHFKNLITFRKY